MTGKKLTTEEYIARARKVHSDKYTYEHTIYVNAKTPVIVTCPIHGDFTVDSPFNHLRGYGLCPECSCRKPITTEGFIAKAREVWGDKYDYSKVDYKGPWEEVTIICKKHNYEFRQKAYSHLKNYEGCPECKKDYPRNWDTEKFIVEARKIHGDKYDYSQVEYVDNKTEVIIKCNVCGKVFKQKPYVHINQKHGCPYCGHRKVALSKRRPIEKFVEKAKAKHGDRYDYSNARYDGDTLNVIIRCPIHGEVTVDAATHLQGGICPKCREEKKMTTEKFIAKAKEIWGDKFDYSETVYTGYDNKVKVYCKECGKNFEQYAGALLKKIGCPYCTGRHRTTEEFIRLARAKHGDKFDYSMVTYVNTKTPVKIKCNDCGYVFEQTPQDHLQATVCPRCNRPNYKMTFEEFLTKAREIHGDKYDYTRVKENWDKIKNIQKENVEIWCKIHGCYFKQTPYSHVVVGCGCTLCNKGFTKEFKLRLLKSGDLDGMSRHQMIELIMNGKLPADFRALVYTRPNTERSRNLIRNLINIYESNHTDAENNAAIENMEQEERRENEQETRRQVADNGLLSLVVQSPTDEPEEQPEGIAQETYALPSVVARQFQVNDETIKINPSDKAAEFLIEEDNAKLWNAMLYANEDGMADSEFANIKAMDCGEFSGYVRDKFVSEFEIVTAIKEDEDYRFDLEGKPCPLSLMQKLMAYKMSTHDCYGNWCGTGAGKTNAFLFSTRYVKAKTSVVITPNGVVDTLVRSIKRIYPNSNIVVPKSPEDIKPYGKDQYTYIIFNYEKFQDPQRAKEYINRLLETNTIDFVCLDEAQNIKVREEKNASNRSKYIGTLLVNARKQRPGMKTLVMTATPCPNCLSEVRSIIEMLTGKKYTEIGNRTSVDNVHNAYKALLLNGFRYVPKYPLVLNERTVEINCTDDTELYAELSNRDIDVNDIEYILAKRKLDALKNEIKDGTVVYSNWVDGMAGMLEENIRSWGYTVECYNGQCGGKEERAEIMKAFLDKKINVLVCSQPVSTGVDGLQTRSNKLIYVSLPWTYDDKTQTDGRLYRQGSAFKSIEVVIPQVTITMPDGNVWSWDKGRLGAIETKRSLSAAVLDGYLQDSYRLSKEHLKQLALEALRNGFEEVETERPDIDLEVDLDETEEQRKVRRENYVCEIHRRGNASNHKTMHKYFQDNPDVFNTYHNSRDTEELARKTVVPIADYINSHYTNKRIADLGCGVNMLSTLVKNGNTVTGFDHQQFEDHTEVVKADIGNLSGIVEDGAMDIAVFCLSLWGQDYEDYFNEAYRILSKNGVVFVVQPTHDFDDGTKFGTEEEFIDMVEGYGFSRLGPVKKRHGFSFFKFEKE